MMRAVYYLDGVAVFDAMRKRGMKASWQEVSNRFGISKATLSKWLHNGLLYQKAAAMMQERLLHPLGLDLESGAKMMYRNVYQYRTKSEKGQKMGERFATGEKYFLDEKKVFEAMRERGYEIVSAYGVSKYFGVAFHTFKRGVNKGFIKQKSLYQIEERLLKPLGLDIQSAFFVREEEPEGTAGSTEKTDCQMYKIGWAGRRYCNGLDQLYCAKSAECAFYKPRKKEKRE